MRARDLILSTAIFGGLFLFQESVINQIHLPLTGINLILIVALTWASLSSPESAAITGFISGFFLDMSPASQGPIGHWIFIMVIAAYAVAFFGTGEETVRANPIGLVGLVSISVAATETFYIAVGLLFGLPLGNLLQSIRTIVGIAIWSAIVVPIILPLINRIRSILYSSSL